MVRVILKVGKKGVLVLPKGLREAAGIEEGEVLAEAREGEILIRPLRPIVVEVDPSVVEGLLREEGELEDEKFRRILKEVCGRHGGSGGVHREELAP